MFWRIIFPNTIKASTDWGEKLNATIEALFSTKPRVVIMQWSRWFQHREKLKAAFSTVWRWTFKVCLKLPDGSAICCISCKAIEFSFATKNAVQCSKTAHQWRLKSWGKSQSRVAPQQNVAWPIHAGMSPVDVEIKGCLLLLPSFWSLPYLTDLIISSNAILNDAEPTNSF